ncbi:MAG: PAS domain S-box protein [Bacteroidales bacterium]|nr:PAS domain S-box protein [Bacteroidales bacterium]MCF8390185.1 PAS domain S-box protein [Bacteroidales bacterium]
MTHTEVRILICGNSRISEQILDSLKNKLHAYKYQIVNEFDEMKKGLVEFSPNVIVFNYGHKAFNCNAIIAFLDEAQNEVPIFVVSENLDETEAELCFKSGVLEVLDIKELYKLPHILKELFLSHDRSVDKIISENGSHHDSIYKSVYDAANDAIFIHNSKTFGLIDVNPKAVEMYGYTKDELLKLRIGDISDSEMGFTTELGKKYAIEAIQKGEVSMEWRAKKKSGITFWVYVTIKPIVVAGQPFLMAIVRDIDNVKSVESSLTSAREQYEALTKNSPDIIMRFDTNLRHIYVNAGVKEMFGLDPEVFLNKTHKEMNIFPDHMCDFWEDSIQKVFDEAKPNKVFFSIKGLDGDVDLEWRLYPETAGKEKVVSVLGMARDITENKRQERIQKVLFEITTAVNTTNDLNDFFLHIQQSLNAVIDTKNCYIALYDENTDTLSLPFHKDEKDTFKEFPAGKTTTAYVIRTGKSQLLDIEKINELTEKGEIEPIGAASLYWLGVPLKISDKTIGVFVVQSYDENVVYTQDDVKILEFVSDQIARAIERKKAQDELKANEERQRSIVESSPDGIVMIDMEGNFLEYNSSFIDLIGVENKKLVRDKNIIQYIVKEDVMKFRNLLYDTLQNNFSKNIELRMKRKGGREFFAEASMGLIQNQGRKESSFVITVKNINERKNYEYNLKLAKTKAEESDKLKTAFLSNMSHEIRTPMNAIIGFAELLSTVGDDEQLKMDFISQINHGADTLMRLIEDIIDISKIEAGEIKIFKTEFSLRPVLDDIHQLFLTSLDRQGKKHLNIEIDNNGYNSSIKLNTDEFRLRQIFSNLLNNAIKFTDKGQIRFGIKEKTNSLLVFYVKDTGIGIAEENQKLIFERFRQGHENKNQFYGGTGIGLSISKHLIEQMGGKINLISKQNQGAEFVFSLPYFDENSNEKRDPVRQLFEEKNWQGRKIIIAEDEDSNYKLLFEVLKRSGIDVIRARTGKEVIQLVSENGHFDLILMDVQMPELDGYEAAISVKKINPHIPIIAQTAYAMSGEKERSLQSGCDDYLAKPIRAVDLIKVLSKYFEK